MPAASAIIVWPHRTVWQLSQITGDAKRTAKGVLTKWGAHMTTRYIVRRQENHMFCVWDTTTDKPAEEAGGDLQYTDLQLDKAFDCARTLNRDRAKN